MPFVIWPNDGRELLHTVSFDELGLILSSVPFGMLCHSRYGRRAKVDRCVEMGKANEDGCKNKVKSIVGE